MVENRVSFTTQPGAPMKDFLMQLSTGQWIIFIFIFLTATALSSKIVGALNAFVRIADALEFFVQKEKERR
jgi:hypothetical protein